jgi:hypothetical protein
VLPARLARARDRFERWRLRREGRRIPEPLWAAAVELAGEFGLHPTARALRLNYYSLKKRVEAANGHEGPLALAPTFCELIPNEPLGVAEWTVELEDPRGTKMRIERKGGGLSELALLTRSLWSGRA